MPEPKLQRYKKFVKQVIKKGYNPKDIWWSKDTGYFCIPPDNRAKQIK